MTTRARVQPLVQITDSDFQAGFEEAQEPCFADCSIRTDMGLVEILRAMLTEVAVERGLPEQQLLRSTGFIIGIKKHGYHGIAEWFGVYSPDTGRVYMIAVASTGKGSEMYLRLKPSRNNQEKNVNWAKDYEF